MIPWKISTEKIPSHIKDFFDLASLEYSIRLCFTLKRERESCIKIVFCTADASPIMLPQEGLNKAKIMFK
jgi:hypothetical protein